MTDPAARPSDPVDLGAVPAPRLGRVLADTRRRADIDLTALADDSGGAFTAAELAAIEAGEVQLGDDRLRSLLDLYAVAPHEVAPGRTRLVIDLNEGTVAAGPHVARLERVDDADEVLHRYLALVYEMRSLPPGTAVPLRALDLEALGRALTLPVDAVERRLTLLMEAPSPRLEELRRGVRRRLLLPAVGAVVAATAVGVLVLVPGDDGGPAPGDTLGARVAADADAALVRVAAGTTDAPAPGLDEPVVGEEPLVVENPAPPAGEVAPSPEADQPVIGGDPLVVENPDAP